MNEMSFKDLGKKPNAAKTSAPAQKPGAPKTASAHPAAKPQKKA
jgi:hypothetical protein